MKWKNKEIIRVNEVIEALGNIKTKEEAAEFLKLCREANPKHADENLGYMFGYFGRERWKELSELFGILHPIFGDNYNLTDDEILQMGIERGKAIKDKEL